ncbi:MAG: TIGR01212 family radical SAM protein [Bacteroidales bacterium]|jgi:radical SAM protein (TIGR01212 family)|nr:TIGR01212 family radical SAM protein [Bacteroidales bacterium]
MTNYSWGHTKRFNSYSEYFKRAIGERIQKVTIDAGFTCPNRDGLKGTGGCTYCNNDAFNPSYCVPEKSVKQQIEEGIEFHFKRYRRAKNFLAYFQAYSNTYAPLDHLKKIYSEALSVPGVIGLVIGTRPDCIDDEKLAYFKELSKKYYIIIEYGIESCNNETLKRINRGHTFEEAVEALEKSKKYGLKTGAHFIFGLPGESKEFLLKEADIISSLPIDTVKFHQLQIIKGTAMELEYNNNPESFTFFELSEYIDFFIQFLERFNPNIVIERFAGEVPPRFLAGPGWGLVRNDQIMVKFEKRLEELDTWQGKLFQDKRKK